MNRFTLKVKKPAAHVNARKLSANLIENLYMGQIVYNSLKI